MSENKETDNQETKYRTFNISQYFYHPDTNIQLLTMQDVEKGLKHKSIKKYAWIIHDKDVQTKEDINKRYDKRIANLEDMRNTINQAEYDATLQDLVQQRERDYINPPLKPAHIHIVLSLKPAQTIKTIAKWFNIPTNYIEVPYGHGAFWDCVEYLTHEDPDQLAEGKTLYPDKEVHANFDFRFLLQSRKKYGRIPTESDKILIDILEHGKTLKECEEKYRLPFWDSDQKFKRARLYYISNNNPPQHRINIYIEGNGGIGKDSACRCLARAMYPDIEEPYFEVGEHGVEFLGYDGEPVLIWADWRAMDLLNSFKRGGVFNIFDTSPTKKKQNVKYGAVNLINTVNLINSPQPYEEFLDNLAGSYTDRSGKEYEAEDDSQSYRRFPFILRLQEDDLELMINQGYINGTREYHQYEIYNVNGSFATAIKKLWTADALQISQRMAQQIVDKIGDSENKRLEQIKTDDLSEFEHYGDIKPMGIIDCKKKTLIEPELTKEMFDVEPTPPIEKPKIPDFNHMDESDPRFYEAFLY